MARYEVDALIVLDARNEEEAKAKAAALSRTLNEDEGPGAFFCGIGVGVTGEPDEIGAEHEAAHLAALPVGGHVEAL